jgi:predicted PurR-regulated permease PerM
MADYEPAPRGMLTQREWRASQIVRVTAIVTLTVLVILGLLEFLFQIRTILLWVLIGVILTVALQPAVAWLERHRFGRTSASLLVSLGTIAVLVGVVVALVYPVVFQAGGFVRDLPHLLDKLFGQGGQLYFLETRFHVLQRLSHITSEQISGVLLGSQGTLVGALTKAATFVAGVITILTIMVMLLIEGPAAWRAVVGALVEEERTWAERVGYNFLRATGGYVRGNLAISVVAGVTSYIMLKILGTPYAETLAVLVAVLDVVPLVGATIGAVIVVIVGFATGGLGDGVALIVFFIVYQQFENNVLQNMVYSRTVSLSPLVVFIAALIGAALLGIVGVLLAIPLTSAGWVLAGDLLELRRDRAERRGGRKPLVTEPPPDTGPGAAPEADDGDVEGE